MYLLSTKEMYDEVFTASQEGREVSDAAALTIASLYQSPGTIGNVLASWVSGVNVEWKSLYHDYRETLRTEYNSAEPKDQLALDMLGTYLIRNEW